MNENEPNDRLALSRDEMRALGYRVVDLLVDHFDTLAARPVPHRSDRADLEARLWEPVPERGLSPEAVLDQLERDVLPFVSHVDHPRFFAFIPSPNNFVGVLGDALAAGINVFAGTWIESSGPAMIELVTLDWLRRRCGLPETAGGLYVSGGSVANLTALAAARYHLLDDRSEGGVVYYSDQTHSSVDRGLRVLGFQPDQIRRLPVDDGFRIDVDALRAAVAEDRAAGRRPFCVVANAGTTNTGAVDPLDALADVCEDEGLWLHVDGAYGAAAAVSDQGRALLAGLERAHSISLDPHKWLFQPYEIGCVLVRDRRWLKDAFHIMPEYLQDTRLGREAVNFADYGIQLTRSFRALKLWMSFKVFGREAFQQAIDRGIRMAEAAGALVAARPGWEITSPAQLGIVSFRYAPAGLAPEACDALNRGVLARMNDDGFAMLSSTVLRGRTVIRLCPINPRTTEADLEATIDRLDAMARALRGAQD